MNCATNELDTFEQVAQAAAAAGQLYDLRLVVSHLSRRRTHELHDPGDPYLQYSICFPSLFDFVVPDALAPHVDAGFVAENLALLERKLAVLRRLGLRAAFLGREPSYLPEALYARQPHWRGPRVDHPRRSRTPAFPGCLHQPAVQALYRQAASELAARFPELDTYFWWTNDSGAGFCWYPGLYPGPNGPQWCREQGPLAALAAFHHAILDGARAGGVAAPFSLMAHTSVWDQDAMPEGAYHYPLSAATRPADPSQVVASLRADLSLTYPVRYLWDPLWRLEQAAAEAGGAAPVAAIWWLSDVYHRAHPDLGTIRRLFVLRRAAAAQPAAAARLPGWLAILAELAGAEFGPAAADAVVDGWIALHGAFEAQRHNPYPWPIVRFLPTYGPVSHRWLTRPLVALPGRLSEHEEGYFLPHVFAIGDEARRSNLLDVHGYPAASPAEDYRLRSAYFTSMARQLDAAAACFDRAAEAVGAGSGSSRPGEATSGRLEGRDWQEARRDLVATARASRMLACIWRTCCNWLELGVSRLQGAERSGEVPFDLPEAERARIDAYHRRLFGILRQELDNVLALQQLLAEDEADGAMALVRGALPAEEDTFTLAPDLQAQLTRKRQLMLAHWQDVTRLVPPAAPPAERE